MLKLVKGIVFALILSSCAMTRAPSLNLLDKRSDINGDYQIEEALNSVDHPILVPTRTEPIVADIWVHPHELANGDYFRGAWIRTLVTPSTWTME